MSEVFLGINKAGQLYVDTTIDASITGILLKDVFIIGCGCFPSLSLIKLNISIPQKTTESSK